MCLKLLLLMSSLPYIATEIVYARTDRLDQTEYETWKKTCGAHSESMKVPFKVIVQVTKKNEQKRCVGVILNKRFVLTRATCYYNRQKNNYNDDSDVREATKPMNTKIFSCDSTGVTCDVEIEITVKNILYPQKIHYSEEYESTTDVALIEIAEEFNENRWICTPSKELNYTGQSIFLVSEEISDQPFYEGQFESTGKRMCMDGTECAAIHTFKPTTAMTTKPSNGLFYVSKDNRMYLLGTLRYEKDSSTPLIVVMFPLFFDFICSNTGDCGNGYDDYMWMRETRVILNGAPLPQVSHCDISYGNCRHEPLFFKYIPDEEMEDLEKRCGTSLVPPEGQSKNKWHQFPYMAAIVGKGRVCSGVFISQVHVVTVAHCIFLYNEEENIDEFLELRNKEAGHYIDATAFEVRYGSECYADGLDLPPLQKCENRDMASSIKTSKVRSIIVEGIRSGSDLWRYKYQVVLLELEEPSSKDTVIPICIPFDAMTRGTSYENNVVDSFDFTSAGNPAALNSFLTAKGNTIEASNCEEFKAKDSERILDFYCRDDNVDLTLRVKNDATGFSKSNSAFLGSQLSTYDSKTKRRSLYALAHYNSKKTKGNVLGAFYPIHKSEKLICWFIGRCGKGRSHLDENRDFKIYTPEYRLTKAVMDQPVQRAGKNNVSNYESVMLEEMDTQW